ncbi:MAG TPA: hypothetical protein PLG87_00090, partial [Treponemataceae bacterium]|nr:hypothetical protein [Treponemataceae bacterium]
LRGLIMKRMEKCVFIRTISGMIIAVLFPWIAGFLSALGELHGPFYIQTAFSNAVMCLIFSLPLCLALLYLLYEGYISFNDEEIQNKNSKKEEKTA